jgi:hypothetical protein
MKMNDNNHEIQKAINRWLCFCVILRQLAAEIAKASASSTSKHGTGAASSSVF